MVLTLIRFGKNRKGINIFLIKNTYLSGFVKFLGKDKVRFLIHKLFKDFFFKIFHKKIYENLIACQSVGLELIKNNNYK